MNGTLLAFIALALVAGTTALWFAKARRVEIPENRVPWVLAWAGGALLAVWALASGASGLGTAVAIAALIPGVFLPFTISISRQEIAIDAIHVGAKIPEASALDSEGEPYSLTALEGKPALIKFFRAHW